jgi:hypothetical protein
MWILKTLKKENVLGLYKKKRLAPVVGNIKNNIPKILLKLGDWEKMHNEKLP